MRSRSRQSSAGILTGFAWQYDEPHHHHDVFYSFPFVNDQTVVDDVHSWPLPMSHGRSLQDVGGAFDSVKYTVEPGPVGVRSNGGGTFHNARAYNYRGPVFAWKSTVPYDQFHNLWTKTAALGVFELASLGATAISRCAPTNPHASMSQALGEIRRDGIPAMPGLLAFGRGARPTLGLNPAQKSSRKSRAGSEYLNWDFGWKPLLSDIRKLAMSSRDSEKVIAQYVRDSGKLVRRGYVFSSTSETTVTALGASYPQPNLVNTSLKGNLTRTVNVKRRIWFDGGFTYHVPSGSDILSRAQRFSQEANHLLGAGVTPGIMWDLTPWSWAADWFANTGDVLNNASMMQTDGLVVVYGYVMAETVTTATYALDGAYVMFNNELSRVSCSQKFVETRKQRARATPFGFGVNMANLSGRQLATIAALGLSRDGRKLAL